MKYYWVCTKCRYIPNWFITFALGDFEAHATDTFCYLACSQCGSSSQQALLINKYSWWEEFKAYITRKKLEYSEKLSITEEESNAIFKKEYPDVWKREHPNG